MKIKNFKQFINEYNENDEYDDEETEEIEETKKIWDWKQSVDYILQHNNDDEYEYWEMVDKNEIDDVIKYVKQKIKDITPVNLEKIGLVFTYLLPISSNRDKIRYFNQETLEEIFGKEDVLNHAEEIMEQFDMPKSFVEELEDKENIKIISKFEDFSKIRDIFLYDKSDLKEAILGIGNKYTKNIPLFVDLLGDLKSKYDNGHPGRNYGFQAVQDVLNDINVSDELLDEMKDKYEFENFDFDYSYREHNSYLNKKEAEHISKMHEINPNYRHD